MSQADPEVQETTPAKEHSSPPQLEEVLLAALGEVPGAPRREPGDPQVLTALALFNVALLRCEGLVYRSRDVLWTRVERKKACFETYNQLVVLRPDSEAQGLNMFHRVLPAFDQALLGAAVRTRAKNASALARVIESRNAFQPWRDGEKKAQVPVTQVTRRRVGAVLKESRFLKASEAAAGDEQVLWQQAVAKLDHTARLVELTIRMTGAWPPAREVDAFSWLVAQALAAALLSEDLGRLEKVTQLLSGLGARREQALAILRRFGAKRAADRAAEPSLAQEVRAQLCGLDPGFARLDQATWDSRLGGLDVGTDGKARRGPVGSSPAAVLAELICAVLDGALGLSGPVDAVKKSLSKLRTR